MKTLAHLRRSLALVLAPAALLVAQPPPQNFPPGGPGGPGNPGGRGFGPGMQQERQLLTQFDANGDHHLDATERAAAREFVKNNPSGRGSFGGRGGPPGGFGGRGGRSEPTSRGLPLTPADVKSYDATISLYEPTALRTLFLTFESADWEKELEDFHKSDVEVPATLLVDGKTYKDVGVHFRGASSYMMVRAGSKRSLNLTIDDAHADQNLLGYRTLNLLNSHEDASFLRPVLYSTIAQNYIPTPRVNFVRVVINGENWGIYANAEQFNKDFAQSRLHSTKGARWKVPGSPGGRGNLSYLGDDPAAYRGIYELKTKDDKKSWAKLIRLTKTLRDTPADQLEAALAPLLDVDGTLRFLALDVTFMNGDGFWTRSSDYSIGEDDKGRLHLIPHDMNETFSFGGGPGGGRGGPFPGRGPDGGPNPNVAPNGPRPEGQAFNPPADSQRGGGGPGGFPRGGPGGMGGRGPRGDGVKTDPLINATNENSPLSAKLLAVPALREKYLGYVRVLAETHLDWNRLGPIAQRYHHLIAADVKRDTRKLESYEDFVASLTESPRSLKAFADQRRAHLLQPK